jgi:NAD(P)-dependent dehydrogenase (short-subunit alcohol dehydrogenase family)
VHGGEFFPAARAHRRRSPRRGGDARGFLLPIDSPRAADFLLRELPKPDILVCAWGRFFRKSLTELTVEDWERAALLDLALPGVLVSSVLTGMIERGWGRILLFGGTCTDTIRGFTTTTSYSAAKTALGVLAKSVAKVAGPSGVTCNLICPGLADTEYLDEPPASMPERGRRADASSRGRRSRRRRTRSFEPSINGAIIGVDDGLLI